MEFLVWHYTIGVDYYITQWIFFVRYVLHYFSFSLLLRTLFAPWKRLVEEDTSPGFNLQKYFETLTFNMISRGIGAAVRLILILVGVIVIFIVFFGGSLGIIFWFLVPPISLPTYSRYINSPEKLIEKLLQKITSEGDTLRPVFESTPGMFVLEHVGLTFEEALGRARRNEFKLPGGLKSFEHLIGSLLDGGIWDESFLREKQLKRDDFLLSARWWDSIKKSQSDIYLQSSFGRPGIGLQLLFGYTPVLNQYCVDLSAPLSYSHRLIGRENVVQRMERVLTSGSSVILLGQPGVGKKTVVLEFAHRAARGELGNEMAFRRVLEFDYNSFLSESLDLNLKKAKLSQVLSEASYAGNIILMVRDIHRLTNPEVEGYDFTDVFEEYMEKKNLKIIAVSTPAEYERFVAQNLRLRKHLEHVEVNPPSKDEALEILLEAAKNWEDIKGFTITLPALRKILDESDRYISEVPFPEKALEILLSISGSKKAEGQFWLTMLTKFLRKKPVFHSPTLQVKKSKNLEILRILFMSV